MGVMLPVVAGWLLLAAAPGAARAEREAREALAGGVTIDWAAGAIEAPGSGAADLRAPSAEVARVKAERQAKERAAARIAQALRGLPRGRWEEAPPTAEALEKALGDAEAAEVTYGTSGSVTVRLRVKIAALPAPLLPAGHKKKARPRAEPRGPRGKEEAK